MKILYIAMGLLLCANPLTSLAQSQDELTGQENSASGLPDSIKKGRFFITPYLQFSRFRNLKLISHANTYEISERDQHKRHFWVNNFVARSWISEEGAQKTSTQLSFSAA